MLQELVIAYQLMNNKTIDFQNEYREIHSHNPQISDIPSIHFLSLSWKHN